MSESRNPFCLLFIQTASVAIFTVTSINAATYYVASDGSNSASGTESQPFATLQKANDVVTAGDTVFIRGGTYRISQPANSGAGIAINKSGTSDTKRIYFLAYPGEIPVFDFYLDLQLQACPS